MIKMQDLNPWQISSVYELFDNRFQCFVCKVCNFGLKSKHLFINHVLEYHPESIDSLKSIKDGSLDDVEFPNLESDAEININKAIFKKGFQCSVVLEQIRIRNFKTKYQVKHEKIEKKRKVPNKKPVKGSMVPPLEQYDEIPKDGKFCCSKCQIVFLTEKSLYLHIRREHKATKGKFTCKNCGINHDSNESKEKHKLICKLSPTSTKCDLCDKRMKGPYTLRYHRANIHGIGNYTCEHCSKAFYDVGSLRQHVKSKHEKSSGISCEVCGKEFSTSNHVKNHKNAVHGMVRIINDSEEPCQICGDTSFQTSVELYKHILTEHQTAVEIKCDKCDKTFHRLKQFEDHLTAHVTQRYACLQCDKSYVEKYVLQVHIMEKHEGKQIFQCKYCRRKKYKCQEHLDKHKISCAKELTCDKCGKDFNQTSMLKEHINRVHKGLKFQCSQCEKSFTRKDSLKTHFDTLHLGIKNYSCDYCDKCFGHRTQLRWHRENTHKEITDCSCDTCGLAFPGQRLLNKHKKEMKHD